MPTGERRQGREFGFERRADRGQQTSEGAPENHQVGVEDVDQTRQSPGQPDDDAVQPGQRGRLALARGGEHLVQPRSSGVGRATAGHQNRLLADLGLETTAAAAPAWSSVGIDHHVPDLAGVSARAEQDPTVDDDAATNADVSADIEQVVDSLAGSSQVLGKAADVTVVAHPHRDVKPQLTGEQLAERHLPPAEVRRQLDPTVGALDEPGHRDTDADQSSADPISKRVRPPMS